MKKGILLCLILCLLLSGCELIPAAGTLPPTEAPTQAPTAAPTQPPTEPPTEPVYINPLTGVVQREPQDKRIFAVTISNIPDAIPRIGVCLADIYLEMFVNFSIVRGLALYTDPSFVSQIGPVRSNRVMFNDLAEHYNLITAHAGGSGFVMNDSRTRNISNFNIDTPDTTYYSFRDKDRAKQGFGWEHVLFARGEGLEQKAAESGFSTAADPEKDYLLRFLPDGTPTDGEDASEIDLTLTFRSNKKECRYVLDENLGRYVYWQYGKEMVDGLTGEKECYDNVLILFPKEIRQVGSGYQTVHFEDGGTGYYASRGKIVPILWECDGESSPLRFLTAQGEQLYMTQGRTFIAISQEGSAVSWS